MTVRGQTLRPSVIRAYYSCLTTGSLIRGRPSTSGQIHFLHLPKRPAAVTGCRCRQGRREGGHPPPGNSHGEKNRSFWLTHYCNGY